MARVLWAFQVSRGSVETIFRWGGKRLYYFEANLFRKRCTEFHQKESPEFYRRYCKKCSGLFFLDTVYIFKTANTHCDWSADRPASLWLYNIIWIEQWVELWCNWIERCNDAVSSFNHDYRPQRLPHSLPPLISCIVLCPAFRVLSFLLLNFPHCLRWSATRSFVCPQWRRYQWRHWGRRTAPGDKVQGWDLINFLWLNVVFFSKFSHKKKQF